MRCGMWEPRSAFHISMPTGCGLLQVREVEI